MTMKPLSLQMEEQKIQMIILVKIFPRRNSMR